MNLKPIFKDLVSLPAMTLDQIEKYHGTETRRIKQALRAATRQGYIALSYQLIRDRDVTGPIVTVCRGKDSQGMAGQIAYEAQKRWGENFSPKLIIQATAKLCTLYGGRVTKVAQASFSHDISLAEVLLKKRATDPSFQWELISSRPGCGALPDAISASGDLALELIGQYAGKLVASKLSLASESTIELW